MQWCRVGGGVGWRWSAPLLAHVSLLLTVFGGAALATAARLTWDPSTYLAVRELLPAEYCAALLVLTTAGAVLLLLPHLATAALHAHSHTTARVLLYIFAGVLAAMMVSEMVFGVWLARRVDEWLNSDTAQQITEALELRNNIKPILHFFSRWHPLPDHVEQLIREAEDDAPRNVYVAASAGAVLTVLQPLAIVLAMCVARQRARAANYAHAYETAIVKHNHVPRSAWCAAPRLVVARCVTFLVKIYYREKPQSPRLAVA